MIVNIALGILLACFVIFVVLPLLGWLAFICLLGLIKLRAFLDGILPAYEDLDDRVPKIRPVAKVPPVLPEQGSSLPRRKR